MRTTIDLPDDLFRQVKSRAALEGRKMKDLIQAYVEQGLKNGGQVDLGEQRRRSPLPAIPPTGVRIPALSNEEIARIEEEEDLARCARPSGR